MSLTGRLLFPPLCPVSGEPVAEAGSFAPKGWRQLTFLTRPGCARCGLPFDHMEAKGPLCAPCAAPARYARNLCGPRRLDRVRSTLAYDALSARLVLGLKYGDRHDHGPALGALLSEALRQLAPPSRAVLVPVPLHPARLRQRRYNQALILARAASARTGLAVGAGLLSRIKATPQQKGLGFDGRFRNLSGAFRGEDEARGRHIVLVDDVLTSGATLVGCARALRKAGAASVDAVTVARALPNSHVPDIDLPEL